MDQLMDVSRRNNLLYFRDLKTGTLDFSDVPETAISALLAGQTLPLDDLLPPNAQPTAINRAREIARRARINLEEKGLETLYVALGMASWNVPDQGRPPAAAVLLVPVALDSRGREMRTMNIRRIGDIQVNPALLHVLTIQYGCIIDGDALLALLENTEEQRLDPTIVFERLAHTVVQRVKDFTITRRVVLSNFAFQKMAMVNDLRQYAAELAAHDVIAAIAGVPEPRESIRAARQPIDPRTCLLYTSDAADE